ncbi:hypothetical protein [Pseudoalteromonas rubra]|uniref:hypothetical protein n=1 Tax=Pseudoalteromonas rubra TaxID=43658 RepID=UPI002DBDE28B|nr:hypothetical protein [Pseudoalteromonas rubra]MEC4090571.1 hypothetical protein [Pseudoalteromonas rubra]
MSTNTETLEGRLVSLNEEIAKLTEANNALTGQVIAKSSAIDKEVAEARVSFQGFMKEANSRYLSSAYNIYTKVDALSDVDVAEQVREQFEAGHQSVEIIIPENTICTWKTELYVPPGRNLLITGRNKETSIIEFKAFRQYSAAGELCDFINPIRITNGVNLATKNITLRQVAEIGKKSAPYRHGMVTLQGYNEHSGTVDLYFRDTQFETYDCIVHPEGIGLGTASILFQGCHLKQVANPQWFTAHNCGWIGWHSWSFIGKYLSVIKRKCTQEPLNVDVDVSDGKVLDFIAAWGFSDSVKSGMDVSERLTPQTNTSLQFWGAV